MIGFVKESVDQTNTVVAARSPCRAMCTNVWLPLGDVQIRRRRRTPPRRGGRESDDRRTSRRRMGRHPPADRSRRAIPRCCSAAWRKGARHECDVIHRYQEAEAAETVDELWYKDAIIYQLHVKAFADSNNDGIGDFAGLTEKLRLSAGSRRHHAVAAAVLSLARPRRRLRHRRLRRHQSRFRDDEGFQALHPGSQEARPARHHRARHQSHLRPARLVQARPPQRPEVRAPATGMSGATPTRNTRARGSSSPIPRSRTGPGIRRPASSTGTASSRTSRTSISTIRAWSARWSR